LGIRHFIFTCKVLIYLR